jgi:predicted CXXCH cytochrome family protein
METDGYFWKDGMVRVSGREYNGLVESPCYQRGDLSCLSCHSMHGGDPDDQLKPDLSGDESCLQCHERQRARPEEHTHHLRGSSGSRCLNCHMPHTTYGLLKAIRSHEIDSPRVAAATLSSGRPNACNLCHLDRTLAWTAGYLAEWYRLPATPLPPEHQTVSAALLHLLKGDAGQRAIIAWHLGWEDALGASGRDWQGPFLGLLLDDPYSAVRSIAYRSLRRLEGYREFAYDPIGSPEERREARRRSLRSWPGARPSERRRGSQLLLKDDETVDLDAVEALLRGRDDGPVDLKE